MSSSAINNHDRFKRDISDAELTRFNRTWRAIPQIDRQRVQYLYPAAVDPATFQRYLAEFEKLIDAARERGANVVVVKPPTPPRYRDRLPREAEFDAVLRGLLAAKGVAFEDLSKSLAEDRFYYDTDHLNRAGATALIEGALSELIKRYAKR